MLFRVTGFFSGKRLPTFIYWFNSCRNRVGQGILEISINIGCCLDDISICHLTKLTLTHHWCNLKVTICNHLFDDYWWFHVKCIHPSFKPNSLHVVALSRGFPYIHKIHLEDSVILHICQAVGAILGRMTRRVIPSISTQYDIFTSLFTPKLLLMLFPELIDCRDDVQLLILVEQCRWKILQITEVEHQPHFGIWVTWQQQSRRKYQISCSDLVTRWLSCPSPTNMPRRTLPGYHKACSHIGFMINQGTTTILSFTDTPM